MPDLTKEERERIAKAAGWELAPHGVWVPVRRIQEFVDRDLERKATDGPPVLTTDELFGLLDKSLCCYQYTKTFKAWGLQAELHRIQWRYRSHIYDVQELARRLALERAVLAGLEKGASDGA